MITAEFLKKLALSSQAVKDLHDRAGQIVPEQR
jgi:hypothetical protein